MTEQKVQAGSPEETHVMFSKLRALLRVGQFEAKYEAAVQEAHKFCSNLIEQIEGLLIHGEQETGLSAGPAPDTSGLASGAVQDSGRQDPVAASDGAGQQVASAGAATAANGEPVHPG